MAKKKLVRQTVVNDPEDIFGGMGHFVPCPTIQIVEVKPPTKAQRKKIVQRLIDRLDPPREVIAKPKTVKRAPKKKKSVPPKRGAKNVTKKQVKVKSPAGHDQWVDLEPSLSELLTEGWVIVDGDVPVSQAYAFFNLTPEEV